MPSRTPQPIPLKWYADPELCQIERNVIFNDTPCYYSHASSVPRVGDYHVLENTFNRCVMVHNESGIEVISNVCRHRQASLLHGRGHQRAIVCPVHHWKYGLDGQGLSTPQMDGAKCESLDRYTTVNWHGLIFNDHSHIAMTLNNSKHFESLKERNFIFQSSENLTCDYNWKIFMETYLDLYHIHAIHPGLRKFANCSDVHWDFSPYYSSQSVGTLTDADINPSVHYRTYMQSLNALDLGPEDRRIVWYALHPNIMIEIYPLNMVVSIIWPITPDRSLNVVEFLADERLLATANGQEVHSAFKSAYLETAAEDDRACVRMQEGRAALYQTGKEEYGPCHDPLELGIVPFYDYWQNYFNDKAA